MSEPYVGQIMIFSFNFAPQNWLFCNGALLSIVQNQALFAILGTTYGGDGRTTFAVPNIQDSCIVGSGQGPGLSNYALGETAGIAEVTLTQQQMPTHNHTANASAAKSTTDYVPGVTNGSWMGDQVRAGALFLPNTDGSKFSAQTISIAGGSLPHPNEQPYLGMNYCIAQFGIFPSRS
jgi:microcystin-dependent protein